jgi:hypothetical protein
MSEIIPMDENGLLEPSFADAIAAIEQSTELPPSAIWRSEQTQWQSAWSPPWGAVALKVNQLHHVRQRRRMEDAGQPQVECESGLALVPQGQ